MSRIATIVTATGLACSACYAAAADDAAKTIETYFVVVDEAPIRDAVTGKPLGKLERGSWLCRFQGETSFRCYEFYAKQVLFKAGDALPSGEAREFFDKRLKDRPDAADYADRAAIEAANDSYEEAVADLDRALKLDPDLYRALRRRADSRYFLALRVRDADESRRLAEEGLHDADRCVELRSDDFRGYDVRCWLRGRVYGAAEALDDIKKALELRPDHPPLYNNRAKYFIDLGRHDDALADLNRAIELAPDYSDAYSNRGIVYHYRRDFARAIDDATQAIKHNPLNVSAWNNRGNAYMELKQWDKVIEDFGEVIRLRPDSSDGYFGRANVHFSRGTDMDEQDYVRKSLPVPARKRRSTEAFLKSVEDCNVGIAKNPRDYKCFNTKGNALKKLDKPREAIEVFDEAMSRLAEEGREVPYEVIDENGKKHMAWDAVEKTLDFAEAPAKFDNETHRVALAYPHRATIAAITGNRADAWRMILQDSEKRDPAAAANMLTDLTRAIIFDPNNADYFRVRGYYNLEFQRWEQAFSDLTRATQLRPNYVDAIKGRVIALMGLGRYDDAWEDARKLEKLGSPLDAQTLDRLRRESGIMR